MVSKIEPAAIALFQRDFETLRQSLSKVVVGYGEVIENLLVCFFAGGNLLIDSEPGLGKTLIVKALSRVLDLHSSRIQFTPDLMPADIIGTTIVQQAKDGKKHFSFHKGPVFTQLLLADEINRATPKTQSALLEAMQERHVSAGGRTYPLDRPYFVIATMNSRETGGTYALPEAQVDRFLFKLTLGRPSLDDLQEISRRGGDGLAGLAPIIDSKRAAAMQALVLSVEAPPELRRFAIELVLQTNPASDRSVDAARKYLRYGSSPRGVQALILGAKVRALVAGRDEATREDVLDGAKPALAHRLILNFEGEAEGIRTEGLIEQVLTDLAAGAQLQKN